jgi:hypothetical protein
MTATASAVTPRTGEQPAPVTDDGTLRLSSGPPRTLRAG